MAFNLAEISFAVITKKIDLPKMETLAEFPPVALLYVTFNDAMPEIIDKLKEQTYKNYKIFILDDSTDEYFKNIVDSYKYHVLRRSDREGFKAGALNNWLSSHGHLYKYFVISDSDSQFNSTFIEDMVKYGEHPDNKQVAIFQSKIDAWNKDRIFPWAFSVCAPVSHYLLDKIANQCDLLVSWGHNNLHRTQAIIDVGGFEERFLSEDFATGLNLIKRGFKCRLVDVISYEAIPETIASFTKRQARWAKQNLELIRFDMAGVSFFNQFILFMSIYQYTIWMVYIIGIILVVFSYDSSLDDVIYFLNSFHSNIRLDDNFQKMVMLWIFYVMTFFFLRIPLCIKLNIPVKEYFKSFIITISASYYMMVIITKEQFKAILGEVPHFDVTIKKTAVYTFKKEVEQFALSYLFILLVLIGVIRNPLSLLLNFVFLIPLLTSPLVMHLISKERILSLDSSAQNCHKYAKLRN